MIPARISLMIAQNNAPEKEFIFEEPAECVIGRAGDCDIQIPVESHEDVSRHHCVLEIHPPHVQVRDLGSLNGTYVNNQKIGQRLPSQITEESGLWPSAALPLKNGDKLRVGHVTFQVRVDAGEACARDELARLLQTLDREAIMNDLTVMDKPLTEELAERIEANVLRRAWGRVCNFHVVIEEGGLVLRGRTRTYYAKQLVQEAAAEATELPILANEVEVR